MNGGFEKMPVSDMNHAALQDLPTLFLGCTSRTHGSHSDSACEPALYGSSRHAQPLFLD